ncbi:discoidin domain-containing protein [Actinoplanes sp. NPDC026670]|uniref:protein kinase domain-containing protein n=1 Tax=Actinoplanes sp. NPDC026670 TaxID=3154700 RepID=UPI0034066326
MDTAYRVGPLRASDPDRLGRYRLTGRLGAGGMGVVYLAEDDDGTYVAVKQIHTAMAADPEYAGRFRSEVERAREVPSFCTAGFLDADLDHDPPYLVTEYVDGPSLEEVVEERGPLRGGALDALAVGVATALVGIHGAGVIHRDLKPDNVLLPPGNPKVIDFGIARLFEATSRHTQTDVLVGTVPYMAPERFSADPGGSLTPAADVFAWGCLITYAGTGRTPFLGDSPSATVGRILSRQPDLGDLPEALLAPVRLTLAKDPADRPTAQELLAILVGDRPLPAPPGRRRRRVAAVAFVAVAAVTGVSAVVALSRAAPEPVAPVSAATGPAPLRSAAVPVATRADPATVRPTTARTTRSTTTTTTAAATGRANPSGRNLALGRPVTTSGSQGDPWAAGYAVDGDPVTRWSSAFADPQWLAVDLGARYRLTEIVLRWENAFAVAYRVQVSADGTAWKTVYATTSGVGGTVTVPLDAVTGRHVRVYGTRRSTEYGYSLFEIEVR